MNTNETVTNLENLLSMLQNGEIDERQMTELPTFGGEEPDSTIGVWSWDEHRMLVGTCVEDYEIVSRDEWI